MFGKIIDGRLIVAGQIIKDGKKTVTRPTNTILQELGYKEIVYTYKPKFNDEEERLVEMHKDCGTYIEVWYGKEQLTDEEHNEIINQKIQNEYNKVTTKDLIDYICGKKDSTAVVNEVINNVTQLQSKIIKGEDK